MLYTTYRPQTLSQVAGQEQNLITLREQIKLNTFDSAYLFAGHRGTGKTTIARILARTICCDHPTEDGPCNQCNHCRLILENSTLDCIELDAASHNSVNDIKELINSTKYLPTVLSKKIYIIDEVHNLSPAAFDALLKTIEEPPAHCIFILCTTELHKIPATIRSRCSIYQFSALSIETISNRLIYVLNEQKKEFEGDAVNMIARQADGSLRDALSIAEKLMITSDMLTVEHVKKSLCLIDDELTLEMISFILDGNGKSAVSLLQRSYEEGKNLAQLVDNLLQGITDGVVLYSSQGKAEIYNSTDYQDKLYGIVSNGSLELLFWFIDQLSILRELIRNSMNPYMDVLLSLMKCCNPELLDDSRSMVLRRISVMENEICDLKTKLKTSSVIPSTKEIVEEKEQADNSGTAAETEEWESVGDKIPFTEEIPLEPASDETAVITQSVDESEIPTSSEKEDEEEDTGDDDLLNLFSDYL